MRIARASVMVLTAMIGPTIARASTPPPPPAFHAMRVAGQRAPLPAWIHWSGWSKDGSRFALRQGPYVTGNRTGAPLWIVRMGPKRQISGRRYQTKALKRALRKRHITRRGQLYCEQIGPRDALIRTSKRRLFAVVLRGMPPVVAVLRRDHGTYRVLAVQSVRTPARHVRATAYETANSDTIAIVARTGAAGSRQATLFVVPTAAADRPRSREVPVSRARAAPRATPSTPAPATPRPDRAAQAVARMHPDEAHTSASAAADTTARTRQ